MRPSSIDTLEGACGQKEKGDRRPIRRNGTCNRVDEDKGVILREVVKMQGINTSGTGKTGR